MDWYLKALKNYVGFDGRARRKEYWMFMLFSILISIALAIVDNILGLTWGAGNGVLGTVYALAIVIPSLALGARRLHDIDKSGWWQLIVLIPLLGLIVLIVWAATEGNRGDNRFGADPKANEDGAPVLA